MSGGAKCWGANDNGQLGDGTTTGSLVPVDVLGLTSGVVSISAGDSYTCALTSGGDAKCWGSNTYGRLGDGTTIAHSTPADVVGLTGSVSKVIAGQMSACALITDGGAKCWGANSWGQLGDGTTISSSTPVDVIGLSGELVSLDIGLGHKCAVASAGEAVCLGYNNWGQLGDGTMINRPVPGGVSGLASSIDSVTTGNIHTCALTMDGGVKCWGYNGTGALGNGTTTQSSIPVDVTGLTSGVTAIDSGFLYTCALTDLGLGIGERTRNPVQCSGGCADA